VVVFFAPLDTKYVISEISIPSESPGLVWKKLNLTQQKNAYTNQKKCTTTQNKVEKTKARFSCLLRHPAWKWTWSILKGRQVREERSKEKVKKKDK